MDGMPPITTERMLQHSAWLRRLALRLAQSPEQAEELLQETWVRALERPPAGGPRGSARAWLGTVLRNLARHRWQRRQLRQEVEATSASGRPRTKTEERFSFQRELMTAVDRLEAGQREAIILRYFEDLPPRKIAAQLGLPVKTINSRLTRALAQLRLRLDENHGGNRSAWVLLALPSFGKSAAPLALATGSLIMALKTCIALLATSLLCFLGWQSLRPEPSVQVEAALTSVDQAPAPTEALPSVQALQEPSPGQEAKRTSVAAEELPSNESPAKFAEGKVILSDGTPCALLDIQVISGGVDESPLPGKYRTDEQGHFQVEVGERGKIMSADRTFTDLIIPSFWPDSSEQLTLVVAPNAPLSGTCVDPAGEPIEGVSIRVVLPEELHARTGAIFGHNTTFARFFTTTSEAGSFRLDPLPLVAGSKIEFAHAEYESRDLTAPLQELDHQRVQLQPKAKGSRVVAGVVLDPEGQPIQGAELALGETMTKSDEEGLFEFRLTQGMDMQRLMALHPGFLPVVQRGLKTEAGWSWPEFVELQFSEAPKQINGRVVDAEGEPVPGAKVWIEDATRMGYRGDFPVHVERSLLEKQVLWVNVSCDEEGRFVHGGLMDREYSLRAGNPRSGEVSETQRVAPGSEALLRFTEGATTAIEGQVTDQAGNPIEGANINVNRVAHTLTDKQGDDYISHLRGSGAQTDVEGRFRLEDVAREGCMLRVSHKQTVELELPLNIGPDAEPLKLVVDLRCQLRIEVQSAGLELDSVKLLDRDGKLIQVRRKVRDALYLSMSAPLPEGVQTLEVPQSAVTAVFSREGEEVLRLPISLSAGELNYLRP